MTTFKIGIGGPKRGAAFQRYLDSQSPGRVREILDAEAAYLAAHKTPGASVEAAERDFQESMIGYRDTDDSQS